MKAQQAHPHRKHPHPYELLTPNPQLNISPKRNLYSQGTRCLHYSLCTMRGASSRKGVKKHTKTTSLSGQG